MSGTADTRRWQTPVRAAKPGKAAGVEINLHLWMQGDRDPADARLAEMSGARFVFCGRLKE
jgi:hypothetical protein